METNLTKTTTQALQIKDGFGTQELTIRGETAASAVAAREQAAIQARYIMAIQRPRNIELFRVAMIDECKRPGFAAVARFRKPVGRAKDPNTGDWKQMYAEGPSIRFIEAAIRNFRNISPEVFTVFDAAELRIVRVSVTDLEANICYATEIQIPKAIEKRGHKGRNGAWEPPEGRDVISERLNTYGDMTYLVRATDDELLIRQAALISKAIRTQAQRLLPGDVVEECMDVVMATQDKADAQDPQAATRKLIDAFHALGVSPADVETWAGKPIQQLQPKDLKELRLMYISIKDGDSTWAEMLDEDRPSGSVEAAAKKAEERIAALRVKTAETPKATLSNLAEKIVEVLETAEQREDAERKAALKAEADRIQAAMDAQNGEGTGATITFPGKKK